MLNTVVKAQSPPLASRQEVTQHLCISMLCMCDECDRDSYLRECCELQPGWWAVPQQSHPCSCLHVTLRPHPLSEHFCCSAASIRDSEGHADWYNAHHGNAQSTGCALQCTLQSRLAAHDCKLTTLWFMHSRNSIGCQRSHVWALKVGACTSF